MATFYIALCLLLISITLAIDQPDNRLECSPLNGWTTREYFDNTDSDVPVEFTYRLDIGTYFGSDVAPGEEDELFDIMATMGN